MYTSIVLLALAGANVPSAEGPRSPDWLSDYVAACKKGKSEKKPLAIFFGKGEAGWDQLSSDGTLGEETRRLLQSEYVPVYLDLEKADGRRLISAFGIKGSPALILSDRDGDRIALRYTGVLEPDVLDRCLVRYAAPNRVAWTTETDPTAGDEPDSYAAAVAAARRAGRPLLLVFHGERCMWCKKMEVETFADGRVKAALRRYVVYYVDTEREPDVSRKYLPATSPIPAYCLVNPADETTHKDGNSYKTAAEFLAWLE
jgi:thioredoxin-related protein